MAATHASPLNGLQLRGEDDKKGTVVASTVRGRPTDAAPFVQSEYTVEWEDGRIESGLSREAVLAMSLKTWTSRAWADSHFESEMGGSAAKAYGQSPGPSPALLPTTGRLIGLEFLPTNVLAPPPPSGAGKRSTPPAAQLSSAMTYAQRQDKSRISSLLKPSAAPTDKDSSPLLPNESVRITLTSSGRKERGSSASKPGSSSKKESKRMRQKAKRKAKSDSESEGDDAGSDLEDLEDEEQIEPADDACEDKELLEFMKRQYPKEVTFTEGDAPLAEYKDNEDEDAEFEPQYIVDDATFKRQKFVLVKWKGYELDTSDWSPVSDVKHLDVYKDWMKQKKGNKRRAQK